MKRKTNKLWRGLFAVTALLLCVAIGGSMLANQYAPRINLFFGLPTTELVETGEQGDSEYFKSAYSSMEEKEAAVDALIREIEAEGAVLLKNNGLLPLSTSLSDPTKISLFGRATVDLVRGGTGAGSGGTAYLVDTKTAFEEAGYEVNPTLWEAYLPYADHEEYTRSQGSFFTGTTNYVAEVPVELISAASASYAQYGDAAIVILSRVGGEGNDVPTGDYGDGSVFMRLNDTEKKLLETVQANFENIIVLVNSSNAMELGFLDEYGIDAALWIGGVGQSGIVSVAKIISGEINPSGRLIDTYAADSLSSPAAQNWGDFPFTNAEDINAACNTSHGGKYVVQKEGIYVGYRYYETRYEDVVLGRGNAASNAGTFASNGAWNYSDEVLYTFGYGMSYTTFSQKLEAVTENNDSFEVKVTVTNTGSEHSGKEVVQVYAQSPYTQYDIDNHIEKSAVELIGFTKTGVLAPGASETVTITVNKSDLACYDAYGYKTYILEEGNYYLAIGSDAHDALNNILAAKGKTQADGMDAAGDQAKTYLWMNNETDTENYSVGANGEKITNQFDDADLNYYIKNSVTYLTRNNWEATWPTAEVGLTANAQMIDHIYLEDNYVKGSPDLSEYTFGADNGMTLIMLKDAAYDDEHWEQLLDQMTLDEMINMLAYNGTQIAAAESISYAGSLDQDGPAGFQSMNNCYPTQTILAATFNVNLAEKMGELMGEDGLWGTDGTDATTRQGIYAPSMNMHRTPYGGRNFEYYSEDPFISARMAEKEVAGIQSKGVYCMVKHFALNEQETNRTGVSTFNTEQAIREIYLEPFQAAIENGGALAVMGSFNRIGCVWSGADIGLMTNVLRNEWGFEGYLSTDFAAWDFQTVCAGLSAGTNGFLGYGYHLDGLNACKDDAKAIGMIRESVHRMLYTTLQTAAMNGVSQTTKMVPVTNWWQYAMQGALYTLGACVVAFGALTVMTEFKKKEETAK